jgi:hypothetical protein
MNANRNSSSSPTLSLPLPLHLHFSVSVFSISAFTPMFLLNDPPVPIRDPMPGLGKVLAAGIEKAHLGNPKRQFQNSKDIPKHL